MAKVVEKNYVAQAGETTEDTPPGQVERGNRGAQAVKTRVITHAELRWLYRNRHHQAIQTYVQFWYQNQCCTPLWENDGTHPPEWIAAWQGYQPRPPRGDVPGEHTTVQWAE